MRVFSAARMLAGITSFPMRIIPAMNLSRNAEGTNAGGSTPCMARRRFEPCRGLAL